MVRSGEVYRQLLNIKKAKIGFLKTEGLLGMQQNQNGIELRQEKLKDR